ncbi:MAG TPA: peptidylprolyl isomerase [Chitinophagales bacterium]|nr:peptidylprolyl isomerase [Chitinophagales bacterium]HRG29543.1 peptidylprolyl isomerase [Chitinophagales bacterium]HRG87154.1 peptidylprolyl isomerase [Chitinophagales bacterium]HRH53911.1 peptidylprolyl isomerase [Chitinophagales bacterium]
MKKPIITCLLVFISAIAFAQPTANKPIVDKIVGQVGDKIILMSEIESFYFEQLQKGEVPEDYRCQVMQELVTQKLMLIQAAKDSIEVTDDEVESNIENRIRYFISLFGSQEKMEEFYGKSVQEIKEEFRDDVRNLLLIQRMQDNIFGEMSVSPTEVKAFYNAIPKDSLPLINAEIEYAQLLIIPQANAEQKAIAKQKAEDIRKRIIAGEDFCSLASIYSGDGSKDDCGFLGCEPREKYVTEFSAAAFKLQPGEISEIVETQFGYHIIKMDSRQGDKACLRHILIMPPVTNLNFVAANKQLDSIRANIVAGKLTFCEATKKYSDDENSNKTCGTVVNPQTGESTFEIAELSPDDYYSIENLKPGEISQVLPFTTQDGKKAIRLIKLIDQSAPHSLNLKDDYAKIQNAAMSQKQVAVMRAWVEEKAAKEYIKVDPAYNNCGNLDILLNTVSK